MNPIIAPENIENCWKIIGVWSDQGGQCEKLKTVIHCRNCATFTQAGRRLLERELPDDYVLEWTRVLADKKSDELIGTLSLLIFRIEKEWLALPSLLFAEVLEAAKVHTLPHRPNPILRGLVNVHGEVCVCVSLHALLGIESGNKAIPAAKHPRMLVMGDAKQRWVFSVDEIHGIQRMHPSRIEPPPISAQKTGAGFSRGIFAWDNQQVAVLDDELMRRQLSRSVQ